MWKNSLCLGLMGAVGQERLEPEDEIRLLREAGFEGFFSGWNGGDSLASNIRLVFNNARLAAKTAAALCRLP